VLPHVTAAAGASASPFTGEGNVGTSPALATAYDRDNHTLPIVGPVPISEPGLTLSMAQALLRTAIMSEQTSETLPPLPSADMAIH
jgi:hypothetical protein